MGRALLSFLGFVLTLFSLCIAPKAIYTSPILNWSLNMWYGMVCYFFKDSRPTIAYIKG